jgi:hypothetical protein
MLNPSPNAKLSSLSELPPKVEQRVAVLGHQLAAFAEALGILRNRVAKGRLVNGELATFPAFALTESFTVELTVPEAAPEAWTVVAEAGLAWTAPRACALLHLPGLKRSWQGLLRSHLLAELWQRLPRCWVVDHPALPPHAAIAGLGLARWADFARLRGSGDRFQIGLADRSWQLEPASRADEWEQTAAELAESAPGAAIVERLAASPAQRWRVSYQQIDGRWGPALPFSTGVSHR